MPSLDDLRRARDLAIEGMNSQGISEAPCIEFTFKDGGIVEVLSIDHPAMDRPASDVSSMKFKQSAEGG